MDVLFELKGKRVTVMGLGRFGGGIGAVRFLVARGAQVTVTDLLPESELTPALAELDGLKLTALHLGGHDEQDFTDADLVLVNPGVAPGNLFLELARSKNVPLASEMSLFWQFNRGRTAGVTGSNGKSTTAAMIDAILKAGGIRSRLGGNIGVSLLPEVDSIEPDEWIVLELSSFQLDDLNRLPSSPDVAVVTNFSPNHLDWHGSLAEYRRAKQSILRWQSPHHWAVLNQEDEDVSGWKCFGRQKWFGKCDVGRPGVFGDAGGFLYRDARGNEHPLPLADWLRLPGEHNLQNAAAAACAAMSLGASVSAVKEALESFEALPHRLQKVGEKEGRRFYNDSLATTPESVVSALSAFTEPVVLLAGGYDKQVDLSSMVETIVKKAKAVALMGDTAEMLADLIDDRCQEFQKQECRSFEEAFSWGCERSEAGDVVLLSPGCASFGWFQNFQERGHRFSQLVEQWGGA